ncbi:histidine phosphatase family protein [Microbacterium sp. NPDC078428]|uniref:histidine phosphatase family protein n=1 Tax=Microbacterium sp. NPDC078428 TaxID=3364190 RepID=UPI0037C5DC63
MTTLTIVRHGQTDWNLAHRIQGATDIPLNDTGRDQARAIGDVLAETLTGVGARVVSSDLERARETAAIIGGRMGVESAPARVYPELRERSYGEAEGMLVADFIERFGAGPRDDVPGAESRPDLRSRALRAVRRVVRDVRAETAPAPAAVVVVSHGALIRELIGHASSDAAPLPGERLENGSAHTFLVERNGMRLLSYTAVAA